MTTEFGELCKNFFHFVPQQENHRCTFHRHGALPRDLFSNPQSGRRGWSRGLECPEASIPTASSKKSWLALFSESHKEGHAEGRRGDLRAIWETLQDVSFWTMVFQTERYDNFLYVNGEEEWDRLEEFLDLDKEEVDKLKKKMKQEKHLLFLD